MKKFTFWSITLVLMTAFTACEKEYTCTCVYPGSTVGTTETTFKTKKKSDAEAACNNQNTAAKASGGSCALK